MYITNSKFKGCLYILYVINSLFYYIIEATPPVFQELPFPLFVFGRHFFLIVRHNPCFLIQNDKV